MVDEETESFDVVIAGSGAAGMTAALAAKKQGLNALLLEKGAYFGGNTARSGGGVWAPGNYALKAAGVAHDPAEEKLYLDSIVGDVVPKVRRDTFIDRSGEMMDFVRNNAAVRFKWVPNYSDYHPEAPGGRSQGRSVEPVPLDGNMLGDELKHLHPQYTKAPANMVVTQANFRWISLGLRTMRGPWTMTKVFARRLYAMALRRRMYCMGNALAIGLRKGLQDADVPIRYEHELTDLWVEGVRVVGVVVRTPAGTKRIRATRGVVLASGGFEKNAQMREKYGPQPSNVDWSTGAPTNEGDGIRAGLNLGADIALMDDAWWGPTIQIGRAHV